MSSEYWRTVSHGGVESPLDSSPVILRCPVMLVVGDQAPYEDAAVGFTSCFYFFKYFYVL